MTDVISFIDKITEGNTDVLSVVVLSIVLRVVIGSVVGGGGIGFVVVVVDNGVVCSVSTIVVGDGGGIIGSVGNVAVVGGIAAVWS